MVLVDKALQKRHEEGNPIRVAMVGSGFMGRAIALQILTAVPGIELVAISNRHLGGARRAYLEAGVDRVQVAETRSDLDEAIGAGRRAITEDATLICQASAIDAVIEVTGTIEFGTQVVVEAIEHHKHVILMNAELDGTIGPILKVFAERAGVVVTNSDGDQPGVLMNLYRFVKGIGVTPVLCGNIKGLHDPYRNPTTQAAFAEKWQQQPHMVTSFADGTKISFEQAIVANATGMGVAKRGMYGPTVAPGTWIEDAIRAYPLDAIMVGTGIVDYIVGAAPSPGVFILGTHPHPLQRRYLDLYKLGPGPVYCFYTPYHLCHFEVPTTVARAVLFGDATIAPLAGPVVDVVATAKRDLRAGEVLDGIGYYMTYGQCENFETVSAHNLLPMGVAEGCRVKRDITRDAVLTYADVELPEGRLCDKLRVAQSAYFATGSPTFAGADRDSSVS